MSTIQAFRPGSPTLDQAPATKLPPQGRLVVNCYARTGRCGILQAQIARITDAEGGRAPIGRNPVARGDAN